MPVTTTVLDSPVRNLSYEQLTSWANLQSGYKLDEYLAYVNANYPNADLTDFMIENTGAYLDFYDMGDGTYTVTGFKDIAEVTTQANPINSNVSSVSRGGIKYAINNGVQNVGGVITRNMTRFPASGSFAQRASYVLGSVGGAIGAVTTGIALGKVIDGALYNANPDYWDSIGMSSLNPETWNNITNGSNSPFAGLFNMILGLDPDTGNTQAYMDANAFAYMAMLLNNNDWFAVEGTINESEVIPNFDNGINPLYWVENTAQPITLKDFNDNEIQYVGFLIPLSGGANMAFVSNATLTNKLFNVGDSVRLAYCLRSWDNTVIDFYFGQETTLTGTKQGSVIIVDNNNKFLLTLGGVSASPFTYDNNKSIGATMGYSYTRYSYGIPMFQASTDLGTQPYQYQQRTIWRMVYGDYTTETHGGVDGVTNQPNATLPNTSDWNDLASTLASLQQQYPDMWNNALQYDSIQPNGNVVTTTYVPVPMPEATYNNDPQPTSGNATQQQTQVEPTVSTQTLLQLIADIIQAPQTQTQPQQLTPPQNPTQTGTGDTPPIPPITGNASALWTVYHPSQAQVDSFGGWLWSGNIITQIQQILQNPMEGIITLHKVFAMPVDSGSGTIVVGRLDSNVPSATVTQQYVTVDCGSVQLNEMFGNVFDYTSTNVSLYLPFIGIVPLNVSDVMRSTINVSYGVDIFTGACLAMVEVCRDACTANLYQYSGVCSVEYPLTGSVHSGLINGLLGIAGGMVGIATAGTGIGAVAGVGAVASGLASAGHSNNARAGSFSGNAGAMGIKKPYLIIERPQTKIAETYETLQGYPTNYSVRLGDCSGNVVVSYLHVREINATDTELDMITTILQDGVIV